MCAKRSPTTGTGACEGRSGIEFNGGFTRGGARAYACAQNEPQPPARGRVKGDPLLNSISVSTKAKRWGSRPYLFARSPKLVDLPMQPAEGDGVRVAQRGAQGRAKRSLHGRTCGGAQNEAQPPASGRVKGDPVVNSTSVSTKADSHDHPTSLTLPCSPQRGMEFGLRNVERRDARNVAYTDVLAAVLKGAFRLR